MKIGFLLLPVVACLTHCMHAHDCTVDQLSKNALCGEQQQKTKFVIVSTSYNNKEWYQKSLDSIFSQTYPWRLMYVDDASPDKTGDLVEEYVAAHQMQDRVTLIKNNVNRGKLANVYDVIHSCKPDEIIIMLDGDDWFFDNRVLEYLHDVYQNPAVWITYGQNISWPVHEGGSRELPRDVITNNTIRYYDFVTSHLKTFYAGLFQKIRRNDLILDGKFIGIDDVAFMVPMLEMAGEHSRFISKVLCVVNVQSSQVHREQRIKEGAAYVITLEWSYIVKLPRYSKLATLF